MASTIKVDNVQNQPGTNIVSKCGTDVTIGASGDTVALACGASQTGFGRTGTVDWITTPKVTGDSPVTGVSGSGYFLNTTAGTITLNLPAGSAGDIISLADYAATWQTNNVTISPNGSEKVGGVNSTATLNTEGQSVTFVYVDSTQGWVNTMDSTSNVRASEYLTATGGTPCAGTTSGDYKIHKFTGPGTFCVSKIGGGAGVNVVSYLVVAGGGGAQDGGGGAGGFREYKNSCDPYTASPLNGNPGGTAITVTATSYPISVGSGGSGDCAPRTNGNPSVFSTITSTAGGVGVSTGGAPVISPLGPGGSGGAANPSGTSTGNTPPVSPPQGQNGGLGSAPSGGGGGGGATAVGGSSPRVGGAGATTSISGSPLSFGGGGGGGSYTPTHSPPGPAAGGLGGGGTGAATPPVAPTSVTNGTVNTGGGGGGAWCGTNGNGGSGIVYIRYKFQ